MIHVFTKFCYKLRGRILKSKYTVIIEKLVLTKKLVLLLLVYKYRKNLNAY